MGKHKFCHFLARRLIFGLEVAGLTSDWKLVSDYCIDTVDDNSNGSINMDTRPSLSTATRSRIDREQPL